jgi:hypothetical protein
MRKKPTIVLRYQRHEDSYRTDAVTNRAAEKEAFQMYDSFSSGGVFYGRTLAVVAGVLALAILLNLL